MLDIPSHFFDIPYKGAHYPGADWSGTLQEGANCQVFAYALLAHHGITVPPFRSSDLWEDQTVSTAVTALAPLDLLLWNKTAEPWGAHVGVYVGADQAIHLSKQQGKAVIWPLSRFLEEPLYRVFIGAKRIQTQKK